MIDVEKTLLEGYPSFFAKMPKFASVIFINILRRLFHEKEINTFLEKNSDIHGITFIEKVLEYFNFGFRASNKDIENIPSSGKVVIVSNHPLGALDSLALISLIYSIRKDVKILANEILMAVDPISSMLLPVDNMANKSSKESVKAILKSLNNEEAIIIFPAGEVSRVRPTGIKDTKWKSGFLRFAKKTNAPLLPVFINARNSSFFYFVSMIYKPAAALLLVNEMFNKNNKTINIKIGELVPIESINLPGLNDKMQVNLLKKHLYKVSRNKRGIFATQKCISHPEDRKEIKKELNISKLLGQTNDGKSIYLCEYKKDSALMREIGRLREYTFRKVGEGSGKKRDIDAYDIYYKHLVLWDDAELELVGAYRLGISNEIMNLADKHEGFYTASLFDFHEDFFPYLRDSIELGRSFVQPKYWGSRALDYLWFGIGAYLREHPNIKYMFGPVSLSASYPKMARELIVHFYKSYFGLDEQIVTSKNRYIMTKQEQDESAAILNSGDYIEDFRTLKKNLSHMGLTVPTLYKQYSELCEAGGVKFLDFGVDVDFENCIDGFILVSVDKIKDAKRKRYMGS